MTEPDKWAVRAASDIVADLREHAALRSAFDAIDKAHREGMERSWASLIHEHYDDWLPGEYEDDDDEAVVAPVTGRGFWDFCCENTVITIILVVLILQAMPGIFRAMWGIG